jgi:hypothetical protein
MNLAALRYDLQLCREHGTYIDTETLARAIHHVLGRYRGAHQASLCPHEQGQVKKEGDGGL